MKFLHNDENKSTNIRIIVYIIHVSGSVSIQSYAGKTDTGSCPQEISTESKPACSAGPGHDLTKFLSPRGGFCGIMDEGNTAQLRLRRFADLFRHKFVSNS